MSVLAAVGSVAVNGFWKVGALGLAAALVTSNAYLGYQWHEAAGARDAVTLERNAALKENGRLAESIEVQNKAVDDMALATATRKEAYEKALAAMGARDRKLDALVAAQKASAPSTTCDDAVRRQRATIEALR